MNEIELELPMPPSINVAYSTNFETKRRFKSQAYKDWEDSLPIQKRYIFTPEKGKALAVHYEFYSQWLNKKPTKTNPTMHKKKDSSNFLKVLEDSFSSFITNFDDSFIWETTYKKVHSNREIVKVTIKEINI